jgi:DNA primase
MNVDELLNKQEIKYRYSGKDYVVNCLSPEHEDRNPSMRIDKITGVFNCVSCGFKGNIFQHFGTNTDWLGVQRERFKAMVQEKLLETVGMEIPANAVLFDQDWRGISAKTFKKFGAFQHPDYPNRLMFPITDRTEKIKVLCGRDLANNDPKYKFYPGGKSPPIFPQAKPYQGNIILVEGIMDMLNLHDKGITNAVCLFGLNLRDSDVSLLKMQGVTSITVLLDSDEPGQKATEKLLQLLQKNEIPAEKYTLQTVKDPGELTASQVIKLKEILYGG